ncbi:MAG: hypothetical protein WCJ17_02680 [bacterium]
MNICKIMVAATCVVSCVYSMDKSDAPVLDGKQDLITQVIDCAKAFYAYNKVEHGEGASIDDLIIQYQNFEDARPFAHKIQMLGLMLLGLSVSPNELKHIHGIDVTQFYDDLRGERDRMQDDTKIDSETLRALFNEGMDLIVRVETMLGAQRPLTDFVKYVIMVIKKSFEEAEDYYNVTLKPITGAFKNHLEKQYLGKPKSLDIIDDVAKWVHAFHINKIYCDIVRSVMANTCPSLPLADAQGKFERDFMFVTIYSRWHESLMSSGFSSELVDAVMSEATGVKDGMGLASCGLFLPSLSSAKPIAAQRKELVDALRKNKASLPDGRGGYSLSKEVIESARIYLKSYFNQELSKSVSAEDDELQKALQPLLAGFNVRGGSSGGGSAGAGGPGRPQREPFLLISDKEEPAFETEAVAGGGAAGAGGPRKSKGARSKIGRAGKK